MTPISPSNSSGNVFLYILIAVLLFGALSFTLSKSSDSNPQGELSDAAVKTAVTSILAYEAQAKMAVSQMVQNGTKVNDIIFDVPSVATFNSGETTKKLFHPDGGGLQYKPLPSSFQGEPFAVAKNNYYIGRFNNVAWTPTSSQDIIFSAYGLSSAVCKQLNLRTSGNPVPPTAGSAITRMFVDSSAHTQANIDITTINCINCDGRSSACVSADTEKNVFYSILLGR